MRVYGSNPWYWCKTCDLSRECTETFRVQVLHNTDILENMSPIPVHLYFHTLSDITCQRVCRAFSIDWKLVTDSIPLLPFPFSTSRFPVCELSSSSSLHSVGGIPCSPPTFFVRSTFNVRPASPSSRCRFSWPRSDESLQRRQTNSIPYIITTQ